MSKFKKGKSPAFQLYAGDFLSDINVKIMTMSQRGMYITLLLHEWIEGSLPNNKQHIRILCENHPNFEKDWEQVKPRFFEKNGIEKIILFLFIIFAVNLIKSIYDKTLLPPTSIDLL